MTHEAFEQLVQDRYRDAIKAHQFPNIEIIELRVRVELLERGETIGMGVE